MKKGVEISYLEIAGVACTTLAYHMVQGKSLPEGLPELVFNTATLGGTLLFSKTFYQGAKAAGEYLGLRKPDVDPSKLPKLR